MNNHDFNMNHNTCNYDFCHNQADPNLNDNFKL